jgi:hypothetical protein
METPRYASLSPLCDEVLTVKMPLANTVDANNTIRVAIKKQAAEETLTFLLGSMSKVRRQWKTQAGDDTGGVRV